MKRWFYVLGCLVISSLIFLGWMNPAFASVASSMSPPVVVAAVGQVNPEEDVCPEFAQKIDLNNANIVAFTDCRGFYPTLASLIVQNSPYETVEDVLEIPDLSDRQKALLKSQLKNFVVRQPVVPQEVRMPPRPVMR